MKFDPALPADGVNVTPTHPLRELALLLGGLVLGAVLLLGAAGLAVDRLIVLVPPTWEARWFGGFASDLEITSDVRADAAQSLLTRLLQHAPETPYAFRVGVIEEEQPNALAFPGGLIVLTTGLLEDLESENELAQVLGHELGHYAGRDHLRGLGRGLVWTLGLSVIGAGDSGTAAGLALLAAQLAQRGHDRDQESRADAFGLALVHSVYGHVAGAAAFFERLPDPEGAISRRVAHYLATHPMNDDRVEDLRALARARGWSTRGALTEFPH